MQKDLIIERAESLMASGLHEAALELISQIPTDFDGQPSASSKSLQLRLNCLNGLGRWTVLIELAEQSIPTLRRLGLFEALCRTHGHLGFAHTRVGSPLAGERHIRAGIHIATWELADDRLAALGHRVLALVFKNLGLWKQARHEIEIALNLAERCSAVDELAALRHNLAIVLLKSGAVGEVPELLSLVEQAYDKLPRKDRALKTSLIRANYYRMTGRLDSALELLEKTLLASREGGFQREECITLEYEGDCHLARGEYAIALARFAEGIAIAEKMGERGDLIPELCRRLSEANVHLGDANQAILLCERGLRIARDSGDRYEECATYRVLAMAHRAAGNPLKAYRVAMEGIELGRSYEIPYELARTLTWSGQTRLQAKQSDEQMTGRLQLWEARAVFERIGLSNEVRQLDQILGFEDESATTPEKGLEALAEVARLDRGALRFGIITCSAEVSEAVATIQSIAPSKIPVLIMGPSGVGKELLAKALHQMSDRRRGPFVPVNCGAISATLIESELFGHERGAFTGAITTREGLFSTAEKGTIFLDEIGELPSSTQATLLRVLETGELRRVGSDEVRSIDVRVVAATNADLEDMVERGRFRRDLFYRLEGVIVRLPALREREDDIRALFRFFLAEALVSSKKRITILEEVEPLLCAYSWPGNVRELRNEIARVVAMASDGAVLGKDAFLPKLKARSTHALRSARQRDDVTAEERVKIIEALRAHRGNKADAARSLGGMKRTTLLYKIERLSIRPEEYLTEER